MPQHEPVPVERIRKYAETPRKDGTLPTRMEVAAAFGINVVTVNKALVGTGLKRPQHTELRERTEANRVLQELIRYSAEHGWAPSQRELAEATDLMTSRVNYLLRVLEVNGLIEIGPAARQIRVVGSKMVVPSVTM